MNQYQQNQSNYCQCVKCPCCGKVQAPQQGMMQGYLYNQFIQPQGNLGSTKYTTVIVPPNVDLIKDQE